MSRDGGGYASPRLEKVSSPVQGQRTFGNEASRGRKQEVIQNDVAALEMALDSAKAELQKIATRNREVG